MVIGCIGLSGGNFLLAAAGARHAHAAGMEFIFFYCGLAVMIVGAGMFKSNVGSLLGQLFAPGDGRRQNGFMLFYMGINLGRMCRTLWRRHAGRTGRLVVGISGRRPWHVYRAHLVPLVQPRPLSEVRQAGC